MPFFGFGNLIGCLSKDSNNSIFNRKLATDKKYINEIKNKLKNNRLSKPLFDIKLFTKNIELAYKTVHEKQNKGLSIENIEII